MSETEDKELTASELLMNVLQEFSENEGRKVLVIYYDNANNFAYRTNISETHQLIGFVVMAEDRIRARAREDWMSE